MTDTDTDTDPGPSGVGAVLTDAFGRIHEGVPTVVEGADEALLTFRPDADANSIAWLVWHLTRVQDDHLAELAGVDQVWTSGGWFDRFGLPFPPEAHGYGFSSEDVAAVRGVSAADLLGYHEAVHAMTTAYLAGVDDAELARVVDDNWDPPVTAAVRIISVLDDLTQHIGQAAYVKGMFERRS